MPEVKIPRLHADVLTEKRAEHDHRMQELGQAAALADLSLRRVEMLVRLALGAPKDARFDGGVIKWEEEVPPELVSEPDPVTVPSSIPGPGYLGPATEA